MPLPFGSFVDLSAARLVAQGGTRLVYEHDDWPGALIKVFRPELLGVDGQKKRRSRRMHIKMQRRLGMFLTVQRELKEFLALGARPSARHTALPVERVFGMARTSLGLGLVVERLQAPDGTLAPTLRSLLRSGRFQPAHREALQRFFNDLERLHITFSDLHAGNIAFAGVAGAGGRFVGIDGMGDRALLPLTDYFQVLNTWQLRRRARKIWAQVAAAEAALRAPPRKA